MTTFTIENPTQSIVRSFVSEYDLMIYLIKKNKFDRGLYELDKDDISPQLLQKVDLSKQKPLSEFTSISSQ